MEEDIWLYLRLDFNIAVQCHGFSRMTLGREIPDEIFKVELNKIYKINVAQCYGYFKV